MKTSTFFISCLTAGSSLLAACSHIDEDDRLIYVEPAEAQRTVLVEDFTGQKCPKCPNATVALNDILETYGEENVIPVAIHSGPLALSNGLVTETGKTYWSAFFSDTQGQPVAKINRGAANDVIHSWAEAIAEEMKRPTEVSIHVSSAYNAETRQMTLTTTLLGKAGEEQKLQLWLTEDSIVAPQSMPEGGVNREYVHNHVLRQALNGDWGETFTFGEDEVKMEHQITLDEKYVAGNCHIVAFTYTEKKGVTQAAKAKIVE